MSVVTLLLWAGAVIALALALFVAVIRMLGGPSTIDRMISLDMLAAIAQCGLGVYIAWTMDTTPAAAMVALALVAFLGSVSVARFRVHDSDGLPDPPLVPSTSTGSDTGTGTGTGTDREEATP